MKPIIKNSLALMLLLFPVAEVMAQQTVKCNVIGPPVNHTMSIGGVIHVGADMPVGSVVYQGKIDITSYTYNYECRFNVPSAGLGYYYFLERQEIKLLSMAGTPAVGAGIPPNVYKTNNPGLGIIFYTNRDRNNSLMPNIPKLSWEGNRELIENERESITYWAHPVLNYSLIKLGPIQPGTFNLSNIARMQLDVNYPEKNKVLTEGFPFVAAYMNITGSVSVTASSCKTQDYTVELGKHETSTLPTKGSSTKWINSDINLYNCPAFRGYYSGGKGDVYTTEKGQTFPDRDPNELRVTIKPVNPPIIEYPGTFEVNDVPGAAKGVGIQLAFGNVGEDFVKFNTPTTFAQPITEKAGTVSVPLRARYIRVDDRLSAGSANGAATFMIEYY
ncbi:fimbrial protein [Proteus sp. FME41]|uniref:fimbrial protein n=1 Tax=Proteus sp. FME41 TaxID=2742608 RepID=UPI001866B8BE|nr:fimbrial protein [Proteus sp. FME41]